MIYPYVILENNLIAKDTYELKLETTSFDVTPGQFVEIKVDDHHFLRRPISICSYDQKEMILLYKVVGSGTLALSKLKKGTSLDVLGPLGTGFTIMNQVNHRLLIGGGIGVPPLYQLAKELKRLNLAFSVVLGFNQKNDVFYEEHFKALTNDVYITTMDGSYGFKGTVLDVMKEHHLLFDYYYACGPNPMLKALLQLPQEGQLSFEERMGCGFGACMGCSVKTKDGYKRICKEGPVLHSKEVLTNE